MSAPPTLRLTENRGKLARLHGALSNAELSTSMLLRGYGEDPVADVLEAVAAALDALEDPETGMTAAEAQVWQLWPYVGMVERMHQAVEATGGRDGDEIVRWVTGRDIAARRIGRALTGSDGGGAT